MSESGKTALWKWFLLRSERCRGTNEVNFKVKCCTIIGTRVKREKHRMPYVHITKRPEVSQNHEKLLCGSGYY